MSNVPGWDWATDDALSFGEGVPRCDRAGCHSPIELYLGDTIVVERCQWGRHVQHVQSVFPPEFAEG